MTTTTPTTSPFLTQQFTQPAAPADQAVIDTLKAQAAQTPEQRLEHTLERLNRLPYIEQAVILRHALQHAARQTDATLLAAALDFYALPRLG